MLLPKQLGLNLSQKTAPIQTESLLPPSSILCCKARQLRAGQACGSEEGSRDPQPPLHCLTAMGYQHCTLLPALTLKVKLQHFLHLTVRMSRRNTVKKNKPSLLLVPL